MPGWHSSASCVNPQLQTWGGLSSALSFKNTSQALNIYYLPPSLRCGATQSSRRAACFVFFLPKVAKMQQRFHRRATNWQGLSGCCDRLTAWFHWCHGCFKHSASARPKKKSLVILFERCWIPFAPFFFPPTTAVKPTWHFPEKRSNHFKEQFRITHCSLSIVALFLAKKNIYLYISYIQICFFLSVLHFNESLLDSKSSKTPSVVVTKVKGWFLISLHG